MTSLNNRRPKNRIKKTLFYNVMCVKWEGTEIHIHIDIEVAIHLLSLKYDAPLRIKVRFSFTILTTNEDICKKLPMHLNLVYVKLDNSARSTVMRPTMPAELPLNCHNP